MQAYSEALERLRTNLMVLRGASEEHSASHHHGPDERCDREPMLQRSKAADRLGIDFAVAARKGFRPRR